MFKKITKEFSYKFNIKKEGLYSVFIEASCKSGKLLGIFGGEDLRVEIGDIKLKKITPKNNIRFFNIPSAWNGTKLKGLPKTVVFILELKKGEHLIKFIPRIGAAIEQEPKIEQVKDNIIVKNLQAKDGNRRPWITVALIDLPLNILDISASCEKRFRDSDDIKLVIDGEIQKNEASKIWGKNWYWRGSQLKGGEKSARFYSNLKKGNHDIELWADRTPLLNKLEICQNNIKKETAKTPEYIIEQINNLYKEVGEEVSFNKIPQPVKNFVKYDKKIDIAAKEFKIDPIILKATIAQESSFGKNIETDDRYVGLSGLTGLEKMNAIKTLEDLGYKFNYNKIEDVIRATAAYYNWLRERPTKLKFKNKNNPLKLYTQYRSDIKAEGVTTAGIKQFLYYYFYYKL
ncbi:hypothetical protein KJ885_01865 [Patescibacteria group bacterium]|nr:hypothetical protein [Patescibacteria group bacterium]